MSRRQRRKWDATDDDPTAGLINLFDIWMVFAVALLLALIGAGAARVPGSDSRVETTVLSTREQDLEIIRRDGVKVSKMKVTRDTLSGDGERLGTAYRLKSGEVVYVPEPRSEEKALPLGASGGTPGN